MGQEAQTANLAWFLGFLLVLLLSFYWGGHRQDDISIRARIFRRTIQSIPWVASALAGYFILALNVALPFSKSLHLLYAYKTPTIAANGKADPSMAVVGPGIILFLLFVAVVWFIITFFANRTDSEST
jgi:hypothetical protein